MTEREVSRAAFLRDHGFAKARIAALNEDASFRRYFRLRGGPEPALLMDAPPDLEPVGPFIAIARHLIALGFSAPRILAADAAAGWVLVEDFGDSTFTRLLNTGHDEAPLYELACDTLIALARQGHPIELAPYDTDTFVREAGLLTEWHYPFKRGVSLSTGAGAAYLQAWREVLGSLPHSAPTLVLRDYHVDNLMLLDGHEGVSRCGLLDFQDALLGPAAYDVASLVEDARRDLPAALRERIVRRYEASLDSASRDAFRAWFPVLAAQRHAKVAGIFVRLFKRDGKAAYLRHIPRVVQMLERHLDEPALAPVATWLAVHYPDFAQALPAP
ncbi:MAG: phosphotransferase [Pseudomonadota bacterium]